MRRLRLIIGVRRRAESLSSVCIFVSALQHHPAAFERRRESERRTLRPPARPSFTRAHQPQLPSVDHTAASAVRELLSCTHTVHLHSRRLPALPQNPARKSPIFCECEITRSYYSPAPRRHEYLTQFHAVEPDSTRTRQFRWRIPETIYFI